MKANPITQYVITPHARRDIQARLERGSIRAILAEPEQRFDLRPGRVVLQSRVTSRQRAATFLIRVFVEIDRTPAEVVTAYRTSKITKYWREDS